MSDLRRYVLDTIRSMVRIGFLALLLYLLCENFDESEAKILAGAFSIEAGVRGVDWFKSKKEE